MNFEDIKVGMNVRILPQYINTPCKFGGLYTETSMGSVRSIYKPTEEIDVYWEDNLHSFFCSPEVLEDVNGVIPVPIEEPIEFVPSSVEKILDCIIGNDYCFLSPKAAKNIKLKDADKKIFKILGINFEESTVFLRNSREVSWEDIKLCKDQEFEVGDTVFVPINYNTCVSSNKFFEDEREQVITSIDSRLYTKYYVLDKTKVILKKNSNIPKEVLDEEYFVRNYPTVFSPIVKKIYDIMFDSYTNKNRFKVRTNKGFMVIYKRDGKLSVEM